MSPCWSANGNAYELGAAGASGAVEHHDQRRGDPRLVSARDVQHAVAIVIDAERILSRREILGASRGGPSRGHDGGERTQKTATIAPHPGSNVIAGRSPTQQSISATRVLRLVTDCRRVTCDL